MMETLIQFAESWWPLYAVHVAETSLFILLVWAIDHWVRLDTRLRYSLWLCALVKAFVPPFYALPLPAFLFDAPKPVAPVAFDSAPVWDMPPVDFTPVALPPEPIPIAFWIFAVWSLSALGFVGLTLWRNRVFQSALGIANPVELSGDLDDLTKGAKLRVFSKANLNSPLLVGVMKPRLYLPSSWQTWTPTQLRGVVAHELAHYHNRDLWTLSFQVMATVLFGLNPLSWLVNRRLAHLRELRCDEDALQKSGISPVEYSKLLYAFLDAKAHPGLPALGFTEKDTPLKKRFEHVLNFKGGNMKRSKWQLAVPVLVALAIVPFSIRETYSQPQAVLPQPKLNPEKRLSVSIEIPERLFEPEGIPSAWNVDQEPRALNAHVDVMYPQEAIQTGLQDIVFVKYRVNAQGYPSEFKVMQGNEVFHQAAIEAVRQLRYEPAKLNGEAVEVGVVQHVKFKMGNPPLASIPGLGEVPPPKTQGTGDARIKPTKQIPPVYPEHLREGGVEGYVLMDVTINANGRVDRVRLLEGDSQFEPAAQVALKQFRFTPFSHATTINKKQIIVFKLASNSRSLYSPAEEVMGKSDFGPMVVVAKSPSNATGARPDLEGKGYTFQIGFSPKGESHVRIGMRVNVVGMTSADQDILSKQKNKIAKNVVEIAAKSERDVFFEEGTLFQMRQDIRFALQKELNVKVKDVMLENITAESHLDRASDIWVNYKGDIRINMNRPVSVDDLDDEFQKLNGSGKIQSLSLRVDRGAPQHVIDAIMQSAKRAGLSTKATGPSTQLPTGNVPTMGNARQIFESHEVDIKPHPVRIVTPKYPAAARAQGLSGNVFLEVLVNTDGTVSDVKVLQGDEMFRSFAIDAAKQMRFRPGKHQGQVVPVRMVLPMDFGMKQRQRQRSGLFGMTRDDSDLPAGTSEAWINTDGQVLIDMTKSMDIDAVAEEFAQLKQQKNVHTIIVKPDPKTPRAMIQNVMDAAKDVGLNVQMHRFGRLGVATTQRPLDLNNLEFYQADIKPEPLERASVEYPQIAERIGLTGKVFLKFRVNEEGAVSDVSVLRGQKVFRDAAIEAIEKFRFVPAQHEGKAVAVWMTQPISFRLGRGPLVEQQVDLGAFTTDVPNGQGEMGKVHPQFLLTVISEGAADVINENRQKAQQSASAYVSQISLDQWSTQEQQTAILNGVRDQINDAFGVPLVKEVAFSKLLIKPTSEIAGNHVFKLHSNFPNPFNPQTSIKYEVAEPVFVRMEIYNITGQVIRTLVAKDHTPGQYETRWDGKNDQGKSVASGIYYYHINAGSFNAVNKMQLVK